MNGLSVLNVKHIALQGLITVGRSNYKIVLLFLQNTSTQLKPLQQCFRCIAYF